MVIIASVNGGVAWRNLMIPHFAENLSKLTRNEDLNEVFLRTHNAVRINSEYQQTAELRSTLTHKLCLRNIFKVPPPMPLGKWFLSTFYFWFLQLLVLQLICAIKLVSGATSLFGYIRPVAQLFRSIEVKIFVLLKKIEPFLN